VMTNTQMDEYLSQIEGLPTLPIVLQQIQKIMNNPRSSMGQIAAIVAKDQALASRAIRLVNSAYYARASRVNSIQQAIITLGLKTLKNLMLGLSVVKMFKNSNMLGFDPRAFWEHSFGTALIAKKIAGFIGHPDKEECFIGGLLHDMGRLVLEQYMHEKFFEALAEAREKKESLFLHEVQTFGFSHAAAGGHLGRLWNIPMPFVIAMELHHHPMRMCEVHSDNDKKLLRTIILANELCIDGRIGDSGESDTLTSEIKTEKALNNDTMSSILSETRKEVVSTLNEWTRL
jgi:HD-like signal output (HDOD) protein